MRRSLVILAVMILGAGLGLGSFLRDRPALIWNSTGSAPQGLWRFVDRGLKPKDWVAVQPSDEVVQHYADAGVSIGARLLIKRVGASKGDTVCRNGRVITVNGQLAARAASHTSAGYILPHWEGCIVLAERQLLLLSESAGSFDGRYLGPTDLTTVIGPVELLIPLRSER